MADVEWGTPGKRYAAYGLMVVGGLIAVLSGGCTMVFLFFLGVEGTSGAADVLGVIAIGGIPCAVGVGVFLMGWFIRRSALRRAKIPGQGHGVD